MSASLSTVERRPVPAVAIVGNDAVLAAAPATPVQLAHACLQRGFAVAVPASWGDELVAAETVRRLVSRDKGPSVMCVCPFVRARLLAPGPDLAPFLVSLVAPPVAAARFLRAVYGDHGVHITYIGSCPSAVDPAIDVSLTPDAFFADIADRGIALSEQPLVFDSIVPPDRRRWCSMPGGVPSAEVLWNEADGRTLVEIDRDDVSTDLAQHIITREHVLLDLAPSLGCVCSGALASLPPRSARVAVTTLEPPRAMGPVIDPATVVSLDAPLGSAPSSSRGVILDSEPNVDSPPSPPRGVSPDILDQEIGRSVSGHAVARIISSTAGDAELAAPSATEPPSDVADEPATEPGTRPSPDEWVGAPNAPGIGTPAAVPEHEAVTVVGGSAAEVGIRVSPSAPLEAELVPVAELGDLVTDALVEPAVVVVVESDIETLVDSEPDSVASDLPESTGRDLASPVEPSAPSHEAAGGARRRASVPGSGRAAANIPRATASGGRLLPRAYVAKRRTPPAGMTVIGRESEPAPARASRTVANGSGPDVSAPDQPGESAPPLLGSQGIEATAAPADASRAEPPATMAAAPHGPAPMREPVVDRPRSSRETAPPSTAPSGGRHGPLVLLFVLALVALAVFVLLTLRW